MMLILDDHPLVRQGMEAIISLHRPAAIILQAGTISEAMQHVRKGNIHMAFVDVNLGRESGFTFLEWLREEGYDTKVFFITSSSREHDYVYAKEHNVDAYVLKEDFIDDILYGLKVVERGGKFFSPAIMEKSTRATQDERLLYDLTNRELDVLILLGQGYSNYKISETLYISEGTVKRHITNIFGKLGLQSRSEALIFANNNYRVIRMAIDRGIKEDRRCHS